MRAVRPAVEAHGTQREGVAAPPPGRGGRAGGRAGCVPRAGRAAAPTSFGRRSGLGSLVAPLVPTMLRVHGGAGSST